MFRLRVPAGVPLLAGLVLILAGCDEVQGVLQGGDGDDSGGIVSSAQSAPILPDGDVAGAVTIFDINLDTSLDPSVTGRSLMQGKTIKVTLPDAFQKVDDRPTKTIFGSDDCMPPDLRCNTGALLQGWPQHPILPLVPPNPTGELHYSVSAEDTHTFVFTANVDIVPGLAVPGPGIKQVHMLLTGFVNPAPGVYDIHVEAETGPGGSVEEGTAKLFILPSIVPRINVASAFNAGSPNTIYQTAPTGAPTTLPYDFLLWDADGEPLTGVTIEPVDETHWSLVVDSEDVGNVELDGPDGATGQELVSLEPSFEVNSPILGVPTGRLTAQCSTGSEAGDYALTFRMDGGTSARMFVTAE